MIKRHVFLIAIIHETGIGNCYTAFVHSTQRNENDKLYRSFTRSEKQLDLLIVLCTSSLSRVSWRIQPKNIGLKVVTEYVMTEKGLDAARLALRIEQLKKLESAANDQQNHE